MTVAGDALLSNGPHAAGLSIIGARCGHRRCLSGCRKPAHRLDRRRPRSSDCSRSRVTAAPFEDARPPWSKATFSWERFTISRGGSEASRATMRSNPALLVAGLEICFCCAPLTIRSSKRRIAPASVARPLLRQISAERPPRSANQTELKHHLRICSRDDLGARNIEKLIISSAAWSAVNVLNSGLRGLRSKLFPPFDIVCPCISCLAAGGTSSWPVPNSRVWAKVPIRPYCFLRRRRSRRSICCDPRSCGWP